MKLLDEAIFLLGAGARTTRNSAGSWMVVSEKYSFPQGHEMFQSLKTT
jgi:hypothetical protein